MNFPFTRYFYRNFGKSFHTDYIRSLICLTEVGKQKYVIMLIFFFIAIWHFEIEMYLRINLNQSIYLWKQCFRYLQELQIEIMKHFFFGAGKRAAVGVNEMN